MKRERLHTVSLLLVMRLMCCEPGLATMLPAGATGAERLGVAAEDLGIGLLGSLGGQLVGGGAARLAGKRLGMGREAIDMAQPQVTCWSVRR